MGRMEATTSCKFPFHRKDRNGWWAWVGMFRDSEGASGEGAARLPTRHLPPRLDSALFGGGHIFQKESERRGGFSPLSVEYSGEHLSCSLIA